MDGGLLMSSPATQLTGLQGNRVNGNGTVQAGGLRGIPARLQALWRWLTEPAAAIQQPERRRQAQFLAGLLVFILPLSVLAALTPHLVAPTSHHWFSGDFLVALATIGLLTVTYALSRTRHYRLAIWLAVVLTFVAIYLLAIPDDSPTDVYLLAYLTLPLLVSSVLLPSRAVFILAAANTLAVLGFAAAMPAALAREVFQLAIYATVLFVSVLLAVRHRDRLERDRLAQLAASEERFRNVLENSQDALYRLNYGTGTFDYISPAINDLLGLTPEAVIAGGPDGLHQRLHPADQALASHWQEPPTPVLNGKTVSCTEYRLQDREGHYHWLSDRHTLVCDQAGLPRFLVGSMRDITAEKAATEALGQSEATNRAIVSAIPDLMVRVAADGTYLSVSTTEHPTLRWDPATFLGRRVDDVMPPQTAETVMACLRRALQTGDVQTLEYQLPSASGETLDIEARFARISDDEVLVIKRDVTERQQAAASALALAVEKERARTLARFIGDASHVLKSPITTMKVSLAVLKKSADPEAQQRHLDILEAQALHLEGLLNDMIHMFRLDSSPDLDLQPHRLDSLVGEVVAAHEPLAERAGLTIAYSPAVEAALVRADRQELVRALSVLVTNALHYVPADGRLSLWTFTEDRQAVITLQDAGVDLSADHPLGTYRADKTMTGDQGGMRLGLSIAFKIVSAHGGTITVDGAPDGGSRCRITLPLADEDA